jgi:DNA-binding CsgD family transcriptional regulator
MIPTYILTHDIELFNDGFELDKAYYTTYMKTARVHKAPQYILKMIIADMVSHPKKVAVLRGMGYTEFNALIEKYCSCVFGAYDRDPDIVNGKMVHSEFWNCPLRKSCPGCGVVCNNLEVKYGTLTERQIDVLVQVGQCRLDKEISAALQISPETVKVHLKGIRKLTGLENKMDLVLLAKSKNL